MTFNHQLFSSLEHVNPVVLASLLWKIANALIYNWWRVMTSFSWWIVINYQHSTSFSWPMVTVRAKVAGKIGFLKRKSVRKYFLTGCPDSVRQDIPLTVTSPGGHILNGCLWGMAVGNACCRQECYGLVVVGCINWYIHMGIEPLTSVVHGKHSSRHVKKAKVNECPGCYWLKQCSPRTVRTQRPARTRHHRSHKDFLFLCSILFVANFMCLAQTFC